MDTLNWGWKRVKEGQTKVQRQCDFKTSRALYKTIEKFKCHHKWSKSIHVVLINNIKEKIYKLLVSFKTQLEFKATSSRTLLICRLFLNSNSRLFVDYSCWILVEFKTHKMNGYWHKNSRHQNEWLLPQEIKTQFDKLSCQHKNQ